MKLIRLNEVLKIVKISRSLWYMLILRGEAPKPVKLSSRVSFWIEQEVLDWLNKKAAERY